VAVAEGKAFLHNKQQFYDLIATHDVLEHIPKKEVISFLTSIHRALKENGLLFLRVPNMSNPFDLDSRYNDFTHEVGFTAKSLTQVLYLGGFRDIQILPARVIPVKNFRNALRKLFVKGLHSFLKFCFYIQDFHVPENLDMNLSAVVRKTCPPLRSST
jgi:2-polyprenyl-3-methyl-5-hydroxy-6-metoxy-1,4-benzoquinol methylase